MKNKKIEIEGYDFTIYSLDENDNINNFQRLEEVIYAELRHPSRIDERINIPDAIYEKLNGEFLIIIDSNKQLYKEFEFEMPLTINTKTAYGVYHDYVMIDIYYTNVSRKIII
jgi:hypothetical protein